jgi:hypothetical protein
VRPAQLLGARALAIEGWRRSGFLKSRLLETVTEPATKSKLAEELSAALVEGGEWG